jgi:flagellar basal-body rod modification protein FlgD
MQVSSATSADRSAFASDGTSTIVAPKKTMLGQDDFLKLLAVQFQSQDPMKPMEDTAFIAQMAQFTALDQSKSLLTQMTQLAAGQDVVTANSFIGRQVTLSGGADPDVTGVVSGVQMIDGAPRLLVGGAAYPIASVVRVEPAPAPTA